MHICRYGKGLGRMAALAMCHAHTSVGLSIVKDGVPLNQNHNEPFLEMQASYP